MGLSLGNFVLYRTEKYLAHLFSLAWQGFNNEIQKNAEPRLSFIYRSDKLTTGKIKPAQAIISPH